MPNLTLSDLVSGLEEFGERYHALDVFVHDVEGLKRALDGEVEPGFEPIEGVGPVAFSIPYNGKHYRLTVFAEQGVARLTREEGVRAEVLTSAAIGSAVGGAVGVAASPRPQVQEFAALAGMVLGLLVGAAIGAAVADSNAPRRVFALRFDPQMKEWRAYDGGLVRWMKERLAAPG
ncbi:hypothetical protein [Polyangium sorediatum]|uniref:Glycine zipper domain-containing protein n=1 Tax=Polyangium sorediatum TaxID=889274 RepID=A0ABT6NZY2_9BACT|nr:hypothetical protein [Polyangium sorediatum]MDI1433873.1 hypothetical protein [Polyangium sorediatum]